MKRETRFLKAALILIGLPILFLCVFGLPWLARYTVDMYPEYAYLRYPILSGLYLTAIPFYFALYQAFLLLNYIDNNNAFSIASVKSLQYITYCAFIISSLYTIGIIVLVSQNAFHPGIAMIGIPIVFASIVVAVFAAVLQKLLSKAIEIKSENDLTV
ncbi:DUF2975 domain-containing protein [Virgibacillus sp. W0430]|uniref:DUF2975 domain-containing protein n=1 Tax=Virgibacillus sp. W0430 TaxID=3391580 RepID=UPI003F44A5E9